MDSRKGQKVTVTVSGEATEGQKKMKGILFGWERIQFIKNADVDDGGQNYSSRNRN